MMASVLAQKGLNLNIYVHCPKATTTGGGRAWVIAFGTEYGKQLSQAWPALAEKAAKSVWYEILERSVTAKVEIDPNAIALGV